MNVLVEPEVHDIFARIPGFGFVQTFYSQDTRYGEKTKPLINFGYFRFMSPSRDAQSLHEVLNAVIFMRGLILLHAWVEMVLFSMHLIYLEVLCHPLSHLIWDLLDFSLLILYGS